MRINSILELGKIEIAELFQFQRGLQNQINKLGQNKNRNVEKITKLELDLCYIQREIQMRTEKRSKEITKSM